jgi:hypothetical protein
LFSNNIYVATPDGIADYCHITPRKTQLLRNKGMLQKKNLIGIFQLGSGPPPLPHPIGKKKKKKYFICLFHFSEHFKATFFIFSPQLENDPSLTPPPL